jgi:TonB family protein
MAPPQELWKFELTENRKSGFRKLVLVSLTLHVSLFILVPLLSSIHGKARVVPQNYFFDMVDARQRWKPPATRTRPVEPAKKEKPPAKAKKVIEKAISTKKEIAKKEEKPEKEEKPAPPAEVTSNDPSKADDSPLSNEMTIGRPDFPFSYYGMQIRNAVEQNWRQAPQELLGSENQLVVVVKFDIRKDGSVAGLQILESSWNSLLDKLAMRAIEKAKFPPVPGDFQSLAITYRLVLRRAS